MKPPEVEHNGSRCVIWLQEMATMELHIAVGVLLSFLPWNSSPSGLSPGWAARALGRSSFPQGQPTLDALLTDVLEEQEGNEDDGQCLSINKFACSHFPVTRGYALRS